MLSIKKRSGNQLLLKVIIVLLIPATLYFLLKHAFPRLSFTKEGYGDYYWPRRFWLLTHVIFGIIATLTGPFQFVPAIRNNYWALHRNLGKLYLLSVFTAAVAAIYLAFTSSITQWYTYGLAVGASIWIYTGVMAYVHIKNRRTKQHRKMMIRNYVVTFFFIIFFGIYDLMIAGGIDAYNSLMLSILPWACLFIPLALTEYFIKERRISPK
jgi:uncharacterized membrane protein